MGLRVGLVYDERMCAHRDDNPEHLHHPEQPARISSIYDRLKTAGILERCVTVDARKATTEELRTVHSERHVALMQEISTMPEQERNRLQECYNSIYFNPGSSESALLAAGSVIEVATQVAEGKLAAGACVVRPPGHHAEADGAMGFCLFNNVAVAGCILKKRGVQKVLIVDWDVHHGNGTQHIFWNDAQVLYFSVHRFDNGAFYPFLHDGNYNKVGGDDGEGYNINVPWPRGGFGDADFFAVWEQILMPVAQEYNPEMVLISAGFDSAAGDPLGECEVTPRGYFEMTQQLMQLANGHVVLVLEGGYNLVSISECYLACMQALLGDPSPRRSCVRELLPETLPLLKEVQNELKKYWSGLGQNKDSLATAPCLAAKEISIMITEEEELSMMSPVSRKKKMEERRAESQAAQEPITDLLSRMSKLSPVEDGVFSSHARNEPNGFTTGAERVSDTLSTVIKAEASAQPSSLEITEVGVAIKENGLTSTSNGGHDRVVPYEYLFSDQSRVEEIPAASFGSESKYVWYACYASNMWKPRFMCYIQGGQVEGMARACHGCTDKTPPLASDWLTISNRLFFGHEYTLMWGWGGVAFLDPVPEAGVCTHVRIYKITMEQFNDVLSQENLKKLGVVRVDDNRIDLLRQGPPSAPSHHMDLFKDNWYGGLKYLGEKDDLPILTFTCPGSLMEKFRSREVGTFCPSDRYRTVIARGLIEDLGLTEEEALQYMLSAVLPEKDLHSLEIMTGSIKTETES